MPRCLNRARNASESYPRSAMTLRRWERGRPRPTRNLHMLEHALREPTFGNLRGRKLHSDRNALAVYHHHALRPFPATCFADCRAPFFAVMNVASRKASSQSSNRRWSSRDHSFCHAASQIPSSSHIRSRRQQVEPSGYCSGRSRHLAPVRRTHNIPSRQDRFDAQGLGLVRPGVPSAQETTGPIHSNAYCPTELPASSASCQKINKLPASDISTYT